MGGTALLLAATVACGPPERVTSGAKVEDAVDTLTSQESATVVARLDGTPQQVRGFLEAAGQGASRRQAARLAEAELTVSLGADRPLRELEAYGPQTHLALALNLGDKDVLAYKSVAGKVYLRLQLRELARRGHLARPELRRIGNLLRLADRLPRSLNSARALLKGRWVKLDPHSFQDFDWAVEKLAGMPVTGDRARGAGSVLDGTELRELLGGLEKVLVEKGTYPRAADEPQDDPTTSTERLEVALPAREVARELAPAVAPLGVRLRPSGVPEREVTAELTIRRGVLATLTLDLGKLTDRDGSARLPLRLEFAGGDALSVAPPGKAKRLRPQDMLAAFLYGRLRPGVSGRG